MGLTVKIGKKNKNGYHRNIQSVDMVDLYSYTQSALIAVNFLSYTRGTETSQEMGFCIAAVRRSLFVKTKYDSGRKTRLPLGTLRWGKHTELDPRLLKDKSLLDTLVADLKGYIDIWPSELEKQHHQTNP